MKCNVGTTDRVIRFVIAIVAAVLYFTEVVTGTAGIVLLVVGAIALLTGLVGRCGLYYPLKISTRKKS
jgi:uncharacterized membrane protein YtjA (UPF0391 family)